MALNTPIPWTFFLLALISSALLLYSICFCTKLQNSLMHIQQQPDLLMVKLLALVSSSLL
jgi:hypothetical protein